MFSIVWAIGKLAFVIMFKVNIDTGNRNLNQKKKPKPIVVVENNNYYNVD